MQNSESGQRRVLAEHLGERYNIDAAWLTAVYPADADADRPRPNSDAEGESPPYASVQAPPHDLWSAAEANDVPPALAAAARSRLLDASGVSQRSRGGCAEVRRAEDETWQLACLNGVPSCKPVLVKRLSSSMPRWPSTCKTALLIVAAVRAA